MMMMADPEDGGYATTDEELDSDTEDADVELDLKMWLKQLESPTTTTSKNLSSKPRASTNVSSDAKTTKLDKELDIDFDSILGELNSLDEQFNDVQQSDSSSSSRSASSAPIPPTKKNNLRPPEKPKFAKTSQANDSKLSDDFGDINAQLQDALFELNKLVDDDTSTTKKSAAQPPAAAAVSQAQRVSASSETNRKPSATSGSGHSTQHPTQHPQREKHHTEAAVAPPVVHAQRVNAVAENGQQRGAAGSIQIPRQPQHAKHPTVENERGMGKKQSADSLMPQPLPHHPPSSPGGRKSWKDEGSGGRDDVVSVKSVDSRSSVNSANLTVKSARSSGRSAVSESLPQVCVKVFSPDGSSKSVLADESTTVGELCEILIEKHIADRNLTWGIVEQMPDLFMQRMLEDHQLVLEATQGWPTQTTNRLVFLETPKKYDMFDKSRVLDEVTWQATELEGWLHLKADGKKAWKKQGFVIRNGGICYASKGKGKSEPPCLKLLSEVEVYTGVAWKKKFKAPTEFGIALKPGLLQKKSLQDIKYLCTDDSGLMWKWVTAIRLAKHGFQLYRNYVQYVLGHGADGSLTPSNTTRTTTAADSTVFHTSISKPTAPQRVSDANIEQPMTPYEQPKDYQTGTLRRGSADSSRGSLASTQDVASTSKIKAQIPLTAQTGRLFSMQQQPSFNQTLPRSMSRGGMESPMIQAQTRNGHQRLPSVPYSDMPPPQQHQRPGMDIHPGFRTPSPDLPLPPPPPELLAPPSPDLSPPPVPYSSGTLRSPTTRKMEPPPPPRRDQTTKLSFKGKSSNVVQTQNFILNLQRAIGQKQHHGAAGICQLEMPLPPPPVYSDDPSYLDLGELPPPPAELLEELKVMKRRSRQPPPPTLAKNSTLRSTKLR